jgi:uncharacterized membrane protein YbhN (UPF0104 family)
MREAGTVFILTLIGGIISVLPAGMGTFQAAALIGLVGIGYSEEEGLMLAILLQIQALALASCHAAFVLGFGDFRLSQVRSLVVRP